MLYDMAEFEKILPLSLNVYDRAYRKRGLAQQKLRLPEHLQ